MELKCKQCILGIVSHSVFKSIELPKDHGNIHEYQAGSSKELLQILVQHICCCVQKAAMDQLDKTRATDAIQVKIALRIFQKVK